MRILLVLHTSWDANLGAPRVMVNLAHHYSARGHHVEHFTLDRVGSIPSRLRAYPELWFPLAVARFVRRHRCEFDVIDAYETGLPIARGLLGYKGVVVCRSSGLVALYDGYASYAAHRWPDLPRGSVGGRFLRSVVRALRVRQARQSMHNADAVIVVNGEEDAYVRRCLDQRVVCSVMPNALPSRELDKLGAVGDVAQRCASHRVAAIGYWSDRKGSRDWPMIASGILEHVRDAQFSFLGTGKRSDVVHAELGITGASVNVMPTFANDDLAGLLEDVQVGAMPTYIEAHPLAAVEQLAAGIPVVAYDGAGTRQALGAVADELIVARGDARAFALRCVEILTMRLQDYGALSRRCRDVAQCLTLEKVGDDTLALYDHLTTDLRVTRG